MTDTLFEMPDVRKGDWAATASGRKFYPYDPRPEDINIGDIAHGLAKAPRYAGHGRIDLHFSVAEHSVLLAHYARYCHWPWDAVLAVLLHDSPEFIACDLVRPVKRGLHGNYETMHEDILMTVLHKYGVARAYARCREAIADIDDRIGQHERDAIMPHRLEYGTDRLPPLEGVVIHCWPARMAKLNFLMLYQECCTNLGRMPEEWEM